MRIIKGMVDSFIEAHQEYKRIREAAINRDIWI